MGAVVLAGLGDVAVTVWEWARATFAWSDALTGGLALAAGIAAWVAISQNRKARTIAREAKEAAERGNVVAEHAKVAAEEANEIARGSNRISERMEALAREANEFAQRALTTGEGAKEAAVEANEISRAANTLAQDANDLFKQQEERATERHDVRWEGAFVRPGVYRLTNKGAHTAYQVVATVAYGSDECEKKADEVPGREFLEFELPEAKQEYLSRRAQIEEFRANKRRRAQERAVAERGPFPRAEVRLATTHQDYADDMQIQQLQLVLERVGEHVQWESARGVVPQPHDEAPVHGYLGAEL